MAWWAGLHTPEVRNRLVGWHSFTRIRNMQQRLLFAGAKRARVWSKDWSGETCPCVTDTGHPQAPHILCYGTGFVGGYKELGWREWIIFRRTDTMCRAIIGGRGHDLAPVDGPPGTWTVTTDWIPGTGLLPGTAKSDAQRRTLAVTYSVDNVTWTPSITFPVIQFRIRVVGPRTDFEVVRVRGQEGVMEMLFSESPPTRLEELAKAGFFGEKLMDINCWTLGPPIMYSGDVLEWLEGVYLMQRYLVVTNRVSQFRDTNTTTDAITQVLGLRRVTTAQQPGRIW